MKSKNKTDNNRYTSEKEAREAKTEVYNIIVHNKDKDYYFLSCLSQAMTKRVWNDLFHTIIN